ncbi:MAG TPA: hypothetical protein VGB63_09320 [Pedobacter sp.]|jgi:hypothetical protein
MNYTEFITSLRDSIPHVGLSVYSQAMWFDAKGDWEKAHELVQDLNDKSAAHIHAYLHRKEGDLFNADYWYRRAGKSRPVVSLKEEWTQIVEQTLA